MKIEINYLSATTIGGFNPSILTPDFLRNYCSFESGYEPTGQTTPVLTELNFGDIKFLMELNKLQIVLHDIEDFNEKLPLEIMVKYLDVLKYTPLDFFGVNLNYTLSNFKYSALTEYLKDPYFIGNNMKIEPLSISLIFKKPNSKGLSLSEVTIIHYLDDNFKNNLRFSFHQDSVTINNNFEIKELGKDRSKIKLLLDKYPNLLEANDKLVSLIGGL